VKGRTRARNIVTASPGPKGKAATEDISTPKKAWSLLIPDDIVDKIVTQTKRSPDVVPTV